MSESTPYEGSRGTAGGQVPAHALAPGTQLLEFEIVGVLGEGGFGVVYEAHDLTLNRRVAIKEYIPTQFAARSESGEVHARSAEDAQTFESGLNSFVNESRMLAQFKHPALVEVLRYWEQNGTAYMVMPYYEGQTLKKLLSAHPETATEPWLRSILGPLIDAVSAMHAQDVFHLDIAPDNILIRSDGSPLLLDLGAARRAVNDATHALTVMLKPGYTPLEQYADDPRFRQGPWTDVYALGAVMYFAIVGKPPPPAASRLVSDPMVPLATSAPAGFSLPFLKAIDAALAVHPEHRPQSVEELRERLGAAVAQTVGTAEAPSADSSQESLFGAASIATPPDASDSGRAGAAIDALKDVMSGAHGGRRAKTERTGSTTVEARLAAGGGAPAASIEAAATSPGRLGTTEESAEAAGLDKPAARAVSAVQIDSPPRGPGAPPADASGDRPAPPIAAPESTPISKAPARNTKALSTVIAVVVALLAVGAWLLFSPGETPSGAAPGASTPDEASGPAPEAAPPPVVATGGDAPAAAAAGTAEADSTSQAAGSQPPTAVASPQDTSASAATTPPNDSAVPAATAPPTPPPGAATTLPSATPSQPTAESPPPSPATKPAPAPASQPAERMAAVTIVVRPWAEVLVNGRTRGPSPPLKRLRLKPGKYEIELKNPAGPSVVKKLELRPGESVTLQHQF